MLVKFHLFQLATRKDGRNLFPSELTQLIGNHLVAQVKYELYELNALKVAIQEMNNYVNRPDKHYNTAANPLESLKTKAQEIERCTSLELMRPLLQEYYNSFVNLRNSGSNSPEESAQQAINNMEEIACSIFRVSHYVTPSKEIDMSILQSSAIYRAVYDGSLDDVTFIMQKGSDILNLKKACFVYIEGLENYKTLDLTPLEYAPYCQQDRAHYMRLSAQNIKKADDPEEIERLTFDHKEAKEAFENLTKIIDLFKYAIANKAKFRCN